MIWFLKNIAYNKFDWSGMMNKKIFLIVAVSILLIISPVYLYFYFSPKDTQAIATLTKNNVNKEYNDFFKNLDKYQGKQLLYVTNTSYNNEYIETNLIGPLLNENDADNISVDIINIDVASDKDLTVTQLRNRLGIETTPALVYLEVEKDKLEIIDTLVYYDDAPFTKEVLKDWLYTNDIWTGPYLEIEE